VEDESYSVPTAELDPDPEVEEHFVEHSHLRSADNIDESNPYAPPGVTTKTRSSGNAEADQQEVDNLVTRAWRTSIIGILILPPLLQFYSMYLLFCATRSSVEMSGKSKHRFATTLTINVLVTVGVGLFGRLVYPFF